MNDNEPLNLGKAAVPVPAGQADDVAPNGYTLGQRRFRQDKTCESVRSELMEQRRQAMQLKWMSAHPPAELTDVIQCAQDPMCSSPRGKVDHAFDPVRMKFPLDRPVQRLREGFLQHLVAKPGAVGA